MTHEWRRIVATLANSDCRAVWAQAIFDSSASPSEAKRAKAVQALRNSGLLDDQGNAVPTVFHKLLAIEPEARREGIDRAELLDWVAGGLPSGQRMTEQELGDRLALVVDDVATLRRYLVDEGHLTRALDGAVYMVVDP